MLVIHAVFFNGTNSWHWGLFNYVVVLILHKTVAVLVVELGVWGPDGDSCMLAVVLVGVSGVASLA